MKDWEKKKTEIFNWQRLKKGLKNDTTKPRDGERAINWRIMTKSWKTEITEYWHGGEWVTEKEMYNEWQKNDKNWD
jgi:hypothetical protein